MKARPAQLLLALLVVAAAYFALFSVPNSTGSKDAAMVSLFEPDEFAQYTVLSRMLAFDRPTLSQNLFRFIAYGHYYYGYPFYLGSALAALPARLSGPLNNKNTELTFLLLRQLVSVLPMVMAILVMTFAQTRFQRVLPTLLTFGMLALVPAVVENNMWWHPDSLATLFVVLTIYFLERDKLRFGVHFRLAAIACGLTTATKVLGLFFFLSILAYLALGYRRVGLKTLAWKALEFVIVMLAVIIISNPFVLIPSQLRDMVQTLSGQAAAMSVGWTLYYAKGPASWLPIITRLYGSPVFLAVALCWLLWGALQRNPKQLLNLIILTWALPLSAYILFAVAIKPTHFFLPVIIPLASGMPAALEAGLRQAHARAPGRRWSRVGGTALVVAVGGICAFQVVQWTATDISLWRAVSTRESDIPEVAYYDQLNAAFLARIPEDVQLLVYRDARMYFPQSRNRRVRTFFNTTTYANIERMRPDLIVLWPQRIADYAGETAGQRAIDPAAFAEIHRLFSDARGGKISGYEVLYRDSAGITFISEDLYRRYFAP